MKRDSLKQIVAIILPIILVIIVITLIKSRTLKENEDIADEDLVSEETNDIQTPIDKGVTVVVDPGHGGRDPGKVAVNGALEKDINLSISIKLKKYLEDNGYNVIMIREDDIGLYNDTDRNKKNADLRNRVDIINNSNAELAISIHQNSYGQESVRGAQVFYHGNSMDGEILANIIQEQIKMHLQPDNKRLAKAEASYYMLKNTNCPTIIVECGFLSNNEEANLLIDEDYQERMAEAIYLGLDTYMKTKDF